MNYIDLHVHSNVSDGTLTPTEVTLLAAKKKLAAYALTDHDTLEGITEAIFTAKELEKEGTFLEVIPGTEISAAYKGHDIHILGLLLDYKNETLNKALLEAQSEREKRNGKMAENLAKAGIDISLKQIKEADPNAVITRAHFAKYLVSHGYCNSNKEAFIKYLDADGPYYVPREYLSPQKAITLIKLAGGIPVLAHPLLYKLPMDALDELICTLKDYGLEGIETIYSSNIGFDEGYVRKFVNKYHLLMTGGSDFHGAAKPHIELGVGKGNLKIPYELLEKLKEHQKNILNNYEKKSV